MRIYWERMLFAVWLLSQSFDFALTAVSTVPIQELPSCPAWGQNQTTDKASKASSSLCLVDVETAALAMGDWSILAARVGSISPYDLAPDFGFAGLLHLSRHSVALAKHRVYDPDLGRWLSRDPVGEGAGLNLYSYVGNDPVNYADPLGFCAQRGGVLGPGQRRDPNTGQIFDSSGNLARDQLNPLNPVNFEGGPERLTAGARTSKGSVLTLDANLIRFSQSNVRSSLPDLVASMKAKAWQGDPIDIVRMPDGLLTAVDNTLATASLTKTPVRAVLRGFEEALPATRAGGNLQGTTWGEAVLNRIKDQKPGWRRLYPRGSPFTGINPSSQGFSP